MQEFWGRQVEIKTIEKKIKDFVKAEVPLEINYMGYWGISGIGKSELVKKALMSEKLMDMNFLPVIHIDCSLVGKDSIQLYNQIVEKVETALGVPIFQNYRKCKKNSKETIKEVFRGFAGTAIPDIVESAAVAMLGPIGCGMKTLKYLPKVASYASAAGVEVIDYFRCEKSLEDILVEAMIEGFESISEQKIIVITDSVECMENEYHELPQNFFARGGLFRRIPNVLWIVLGQNQSEYLEELRPLEMKEYMESFQVLIRDGDIKIQPEKIEDISKGIPYILQVIYEMLRDFPDKLLLEKNYWDENWNPIFTRFLMNYNNRTLKIVGILSVLKNWDDRLVNNLLLYLRFHDLLKWNIEKDDFEVYQSLKVLPFVKQNGYYFSFNNNVVEFYRKILSNDEKIEIYRLSTNYILQKHKQNNDDQNKRNEINLYLLTWLRDLKNENCDSLKREIISTIYFILNEFLSFENISEWKNVVYEIISFAILLKIPELDSKVIKCLLFHANSMADTKKLEFCFWLQSIIAENEGNELCKEIKLLKSKCVLVRTKSGYMDLELPFGIEYNIKESKEELCQTILKRFQKLESSFEKVDYMMDCLAEYEYVYERNVFRIENFLKELVRAMEELNLVKNTTLENVFRYIYFFESLNLVLYHNNDIMREELAPLFSAFIGLERFVPELVKGEYYFQVALYQFNRKLQSHEYFMQAKKHRIFNRYHKMWAERACVNYYVQQEKISTEDCEILIDSLEYILEHAEEISRWTLGVYLTVYVSILVSRGISDGMEEIIMYITEKTPSVGKSVKDLNWYCLNKYYFEIIHYIICEMKNYSLALEWIEKMIYSISIQKKDKKYFLCKIVLLKYKICVLYQIDEGTICDSLDELKALLYTAEAVVGKNNPDILSVRKWIKSIKTE